MQERRAAGRDAARFPPELTLGEARARHFALAGFKPDGGYGDAWVKIKFGPLPLAFPNTAGRRRAVPFHDVHHILTEYGTDLRGEFEIAAWEIAAGGIERHWVGWALDLLGFGCGLLTFPRRVYRAFMRGRRCRNLYAEEWSDAYLSRRVGELRARVGLGGEEARTTTRGDLSAFLRWGSLALAAYLALAAAALAPFAAAGLLAWLRLAR